jgi:type IV pilus assembly protein PilZ
MSTGPTRGGVQPNILTLQVKDKQTLYQHYMPYIKGGALFVPTPRDFRLGEEVFVLLTLMENAERLPVSGRVVWITPRAAQGKRAQGVGVQFSGHDGAEVQKKIEAQLAGMLGGDRPTYTI